jgi:hypothetical protein
MGRIVRVISKDASVVCSAIDGKDIVSRIEEIHKTSAVVTAALGCVVADSLAVEQPIRYELRQSIASGAKQARRIGIKKSLKIIYLQNVYGYECS